MAQSSAHQNSEVFRNFGILYLSRFFFLNLPPNLQEGEQLLKF
jgi:hypothetical protein